MITCAYCNQPITNTKYKTYKRKKYHFECFEKLQSEAEAGNKKQQKEIHSSERKQLENYICSLFEIQKIPYLISKQIDVYINKNGFTITGIEKSLNYYYCLQSNSIDKEKLTIGIVPFIYEEAKKFYETAHIINLKNEQINIDNKNVSVKLEPANRSIPCKTKIEDL